MIDRRRDPMVDKLIESGHLDQEAIDRDAATMDALARGGLAGEPHDPVVTMLGAWRDEVRAAAPKPVKRQPGPTRRRRLAVAATALVTSVSVTGVAAAIGGVEPLRTVITQLPGPIWNDPANPEATAEEVDRLVRNAERALAEGDLRSSAQLAQRAREMVEETGGAGQTAAEGRLVGLERRLARADNPPSQDASDHGAEASQSAPGAGAGGQIGTDPGDVRSATSTPSPTHTGGPAAPPPRATPTPRGDHGPDLRGPWMIQRSPDEEATLSAEPEPSPVPIETTSDATPNP